MTAVRTIVMCRRGGATLIKLGEKEVEVSPDFKLFLTTRLANPHYTPEVSTKASIINFAVRESGLEAQLLASVVRAERPDLDRQRNELVLKVRLCAHLQSQLPCGFDRWWHQSMQFVVCVSVVLLWGSVTTCHCCYMCRLLLASVHRWSSKTLFCSCCQVHLAHCWTTLSS